MRTKFSFFLIFNLSDTFLFCIVGGALTNQSLEQKLDIKNQCSFYAIFCIIHFYVSFLNKTFVFKLQGTKNYMQ